MLGMLLICNPIALFCSEWSLVVIIPYPASFVPLSFASKMSLSCWGWAGTHLSFPAELACPQLNTFQAYIQGLWPYSPPLCGGHNSCSPACTSKARPIQPLPSSSWHCSRGSLKMEGQSSAPWSFCACSWQGALPLSLVITSKGVCCWIISSSLSALGSCSRAALTLQSGAGSQCGSIPPHCLAFTVRLGVVFLVEGLSHTQGSAWIVGCTRESQRWWFPSRIYSLPQSKLLSYKTATFDMLSMHIEYRKTQNVEDKPPFVKNRAK